ncbi:hypothetical protein [Tateyamaria sp. Alg231-49]|uniref:hypothetical protein n=1 Tax=Tateyamaria sp. Alg231-49 TaxID=1922219 RepID=UPI000D562746|nr:hypothetical protein [Tateyamaria sp. Alg231-49]
MSDIQDLQIHECLHIISSLALHAALGGEQGETEHLQFAVCAGANEGEVFFHSLDASILMVVMIEQAANGGSTEGTCVSEEDKTAMFRVLTKAQTDQDEARRVATAMCLAKWLSHHGVRGKIGALPDNYRRFIAQVDAGEIWDAVADGAKAVAAVAGRVPDDQMKLIFDTLPLPDVLCGVEMIGVPPVDWPAMSIGAAYKQQAADNASLEVMQ